MIVRSANDNKIPDSLYPAIRFAKRPFSHTHKDPYDPRLYFIDHNLVEPSQPIDLAGLLNVLKSMKGKEND